MAVAHKKSAVTNDAVAHLAEAREKYKQPLLEERGNGIVEIGGFGEVPKLLDDLRSIGSRHEEIGNEPEAAAYVAVERAQDSQSDRRQPVRIPLTALRGFDNLLGKIFLHDGRPAFGMKGPAGNVIGLAQGLGRLGVEAAIPKKRYDLVEGLSIQRTQ